MSIGLILLIVLGLGIIGLVIWFFIKNKKPDDPPTPEPVPTPEPSPTPTPDPDPTPEPEPDPTPEPEPEPEPYNCITETHKIDTQVSAQVTNDLVQVGTYDYDSVCDCQWSVIGVKEGDVDFLSDFELSDGKIMAKVILANESAEPRTSRYITHHISGSGKSGERDDYFDVTQAPLYDDKFEKILSAFKSDVPISRGTKTYDYLKKLYDEVKSQFYEDKSCHDLPSLHKSELFPWIYDIYGDKGTEEAGFLSMVGWVISLQLAELKPTCRTSLCKTGYELGGYTKDSDIYGYKFKCDPNLARLSGSAIYVTMRETQKPDINGMRSEVGGSTYPKTLYYYSQEEPKTNVGENDFFIDLREFMPTAAGPYAPGYTDRSKIGGYPYPSEPKESNYCLSKDMEIHKYVIETFNLNTTNQDNLQRTVQAIADKDADVHHLFGSSHIVGSYTFDPVFTKETLGQEVNPSLAKELCSYINDCLYVGSRQRGILQATKDKLGDYYQYGRLRPGCSWEKEAQRHSYSDDRWNVLVDFDIEDNDGNPTGYYDKNGNWVYANVHSKEEFNNYMKDQLYANSYPSGHSSGIWCGALSLMELLPDHADKIMRAANNFAVNRTVARYHWTSDTIQGRLLGSAANAILHDASDYQERHDEAKRWLNGSIPEPQPVDEKVNVTLSYVLGGYGSCHVDSGEKQMTHYCRKEANKERHPSITVSQTVNFTIEGAGVKTVDGKTSGVFEAGKSYEIVCPACNGEEKTATITLRNKNGVRVLYYKLSMNGTCDEGPGSV